MGQIISKAKSHLSTSSTKPATTASTAEKSTANSTNTTTDKMGDSTTTSVPMSHYASATTSFKPPLIAHDNHFLGDVYSSAPNDTEKPITCGIYHFLPGHELVYPYHYHEMKIIIEGSATLSDETGQKVNAKAGDVFYFPKGSVITFVAGEGGCKAFFCGQRKEGDA